MAYSRIKNWVNGDTLTASDLNAEFDGALANVNTTQAELTALNISTYIKTLLDDADASTVLTTLGFSAFAKTLIDDADAAAARATLDVLPRYMMNGYFERARFTYNGGTSPFTFLIDAGAYMVKDKFAYWASQLTSPQASAGTAYTPQYLYLDYSEITSGTPITNAMMYWSTTAPTWNNTYRQQMLGDDRCIWGAMENATPNDFLECFQADEKVTLADQVLGGQTSKTDFDFSDIDVDTTWDTVYFPIPSICRRAEVYFEAYLNGGSNAKFSWRTKGQTGSTGHFAVHVSTGAERAQNSVEVMTDGNQAIEVKYSVSDANNVTVYLDAWYLPQGM